MQFWYKKILYINTGNKIKGNNTMSFNTPIIGYPATKAPINLPAFWALGNQSWTSNYGMRKQYNTYPSYASPIDTFLAHNMDTIGAFNPMLYGIVQPQNNNMMSEVGLKNSYASGFQQGQMMRASITLGECASALSSMASQLENILESDELNDSQKARIKALLAKVEAAQERLERLTEKLASSSDANVVIKTITKFQEEVLALQKERSELGKKITEEIKTGKPSDDADEVDGEDDADGTDGADDADTGKIGDDGRPAKYKKTKDRDIQNICLDFSDAINKTTWFGLCPGTDDKKFNETIASLEEDNIIEVMENWKEKFCGPGSPNPDDKNFLDSFLYDADHEQKAKLGKYMLDLLVARAEANGLDVKLEEAAARKELNSSVIYNDVVERNIMAIYDKITKKETENKTKIASGEEVGGQKPDNKKYEEEINKAKEQFLADMKECLDRDDIKELPSKLEVVKDDKGKFKGFKIRIKGKDYTGKDYLSLCDALKKDELTMPVK